MPFETTTQTIQLADGRTITLGTGLLAQQADSAVLVRMGKAMVLATVVTEKAAGPYRLPAFVH